MKLDEFLDNLITDCKLYLDGLQNFDVLTPYCLVMDFFSEDLTHRINFPPATFELPRAEQFHMLSSLLHDLSHGGVGLVTFLELNVAPHSALDERFWDRDVLIALIGCSRPSSRLDSTVTYDSAVLFFDRDEAGELYFTLIKDNDAWKDYVDNTAIFRDFLYYSSMDKGSPSPFRWPTAYKTLAKLGFEFEFENDETKNQFVMAQPVLYNTQ